MHVCSYSIPCTSKVAALDVAIFPDSSCARHLILLKFKKGIILLIPSVTEGVKNVLVILRSSIAVPFKNHSTVPGTILSVLVGGMVQKNVALPPIIDPRVVIGFTETIHT